MIWLKTIWCMLFGCKDDIQTHYVIDDALPYSGVSWRTEYKCSRCGDSHSFCHMSFDFAVKID